MTQNQLAYQANLEAQRANQAREAELQRSNMAKEAETTRSNQERERATRENDRGNRFVNIWRTLLGR